MSAQTRSFQEFLEAMGSGKWDKAKSFVVGNGDPRSGFSGSVTRTQWGLWFSECIEEMMRLRGAFTFGKLSKMRTSKTKDGVTANFEVQVTFKGRQPFSYHNESFVLSTRPVVLKVQSKATFDYAGKITSLDTMLTNEHEVLAQLLKS